MSKKKVYRGLEAVILLRMLFWELESRLDKAKTKMKRTSIGKDLDLLERYIERGGTKHMRELESDVNLILNEYYPYEDLKERDRFLRRMASTIKAKDLKKTKVFKDGWWKKTSLEALM